MTNMVVKVGDFKQFRGYIVAMGAAHFQLQFQKTFAVPIVAKPHVLFWSLVANPLQLCILWNGGVLAATQVHVS